MKSACFLDTNILIYAATGITSEPGKHRVAVDLLRNEDFGLSGQVLAEFTHQVRQRVRGRVPLDDAVVDQWFALFGRVPIVAVDFDLVRAGIENSRRFVISYWDGAIIAAAERLGAPILYTEDLSHGQHYGPVQVVNPFLSS